MLPVKIGFRVFVTRVVPTRLLVSGTAPSRDAIRLLDISPESHSRHPGRRSQGSSGKRSWAVRIKGRRFLGRQGYQEASNEDGWSAACLRIALT
ncbi:hypothetical protein BaRGS_00018659, partial [Batillaria attramentaria]